MRVYHYGFFFYVSNFILQLTFQFHNQVTPDENRREFLPSRTQMLIQRIHRCLFLPLRQMGIDFQRDLDVAVAQEFLRRFDVHPGIVERTGHRLNWCALNSLRACTFGLLRLASRPPALRLR